MDTDGNVATEIDQDRCGYGVKMRTEGDTEGDGVRERQTGSPGDHCLGPAPSRVESPEAPPAIFPIMTTPLLTKRSRNASLCHQFVCLACYCV